LPNQGIYRQRPTLVFTATKTGLGVAGKNLNEQYPSKHTSSVHYRKVLSTITVRSHMPEPGSTLLRSVRIAKFNGKQSNIERVQLAKVPITQLFQLESQSELGN